MLTNIAGLLLAFLTLLHCAPTCAMDERKITVVFRYDDYSEQDPDGLDDKVLQAFRRRQIPITLAVIPCLVRGNMHDPLERSCDALSPARAQVLRRGAADGLIDVGLHGLHHQRHDDSGSASEFAGQPYQVQANKIKQGRKMLESLLGRPVDLFIPPWNSYDEVTLKVLADQGFLLISGNRIGTSDPSLALKYLPMTVKGPADVKAAVEALSKSAEEHPIMVVMLHLYDFKERSRLSGETTLPEFEATLDWLQQRKDVDLLSISQVEDHDVDLGSARLASARVDSLAGRLLPDLLRGDAAQHAYPERASFVLAPITALAFYSLLLTVVAALSYLLARELQRFARLRTRHMSPLLLGSIGLFAYLLHRDSSMGFRTQLLAPAALGLSMGLLLAVWREHLRVSAGASVAASLQLPGNWTAGHREFGAAITRPGDL